MGCPAACSGGSGVGALRRSSLWLELEDEPGLGPGAGVSSVKAVPVRKKRPRISYDQVLKV